MLKKVLLTFAGGALVFSLAACGSSSETAEKTNDNSKESATVSTNAESPKENTPAETPVEEVIEDDLSTLYVDVLKESMPEMSEGYLELSDQSYNFIKENNKLFPAKTEEDINNAKNRSESIDLKLLNKNAKPYFSTITSYEGYVVQVFEESYDNGETAAEVNIADEEGNNHSLILFKSTGDIVEEDYVKFWGVPVGSYSYETLAGGYQNAQIFFGAHIEKIQ